jgi:hypothetical protein
MASDFFGNTLRRGQLVLHVGRKSSSILMERRYVTDVVDDRVFVASDLDDRGREIFYPERLVVAPSHV